jgi:hypothetical protein
MRRESRLEVFKLCQEQAVFYGMATVVRLKDAHMCTQSTIDNAISAKSEHLLKQRGLSEVMGKVRPSIEEIQDSMPL